MSLSRIEQAFQAISRERFLPPVARPFASEDMPIQIGYGQTNSQPSTVFKMLTWLAPREGDKILDVGSGSGWTAALLAWITGPTGYVFAVEKIPELVEFGRANCDSFDMKNITFHEAGKQLGLPAYAPYDRILVSAGARTLPEQLIEQLKPGGILVVPVEHDIEVVTKGDDGELKIDTHHGFAFVRLVE